MDSFKTDDKTGQALKNQRFQMLEDIAKELAEDVTFPVCFDVALQMRKVMNDPNHSMDQLYKVIIAEPLVCSKLLRLANSVAMNPEGNQIKDVKTAVQRLGTNAVRSVAMAVAMKQLLLFKDMVQYGEMMKQLWEHSIITASACSLVARRLSRFSPEEALLAGLVHDIGVFYMLYRATQYDELRERPETMKYLIVQWHESIGDMLLNALEMPESIVNAVREHDQPRPVPPVPRSLADVVYVGNVLAGGLHEWLHQDRDTAEMERYALDKSYMDLLPEIQAFADEMRASLV